MQAGHTPPSPTGDLHSNAPPPNHTTMYWPLGTPRIYVAKLPAVSAPPVYDSDDDSAELVRNSLSGSSGAGEDDDDSNVKELAEDDEEETRDGQKIGEKEVADEVPQRTDEDGDVEAPAATAATGVLALKVARNGVLFATVTAAELTIWQTKVSARAGFFFSFFSGLTGVLPAHGSGRARPPLAGLADLLRPQHGRPHPARLSDLCGADRARLSDHLLPRQRPPAGCARVQAGLRQQPPLRAAELGRGEWRGWQSGVWAGRTDVGCW